MPNSSGSSSGGSSTTRPSTNTNTSTATETKSDNSSLSVLQIAEGAITPEFNSGTLEYQINVPNETTKLTITATPADSNAIVKIAGNEELVVGENAIEVIVTAENGSTTVYKINAVRAEAVLNLQALNVFYINENGEKVPKVLERHEPAELVALEYSEDLTTFAGTQFRTSTPESVYAKKMSTKHPKDILDLEALRNKVDFNKIKEMEQYHSTLQIVDPDIKESLFSIEEIEKATANISFENKEKAKAVVQYAESELQQEGEIRTN